MKKNLLIFLLSLFWGLAGIGQLSASSMKTLLNQNEKTNWSSIALISFGNEWNNFQNFDYLTNKVKQNTHLFQTLGADWINEPNHPCFIGNGGLANTFVDGYGINGGIYSAVHFTVPKNEAPRNRGFFVSI